MMHIHSSTTSFEHSILGDKKTSTLYGDPGTRRPLMSLDEYQRQGAEFTAQELNKANLYWKHHGAIRLQILRESLRQKRDGRLFWASVVGVVAILLALVVGASLSNSYQEYDGQLVPLSFPQRLLNLPLEFVDIIRQLTGHARKGLPGSESASFAFKKPPSSSTSSTSSYVPPRTTSNNINAAAQGSKDSANSTTSEGLSSYAAPDIDEEGREPSKHNEAQKQDDDQQQTTGELVQSPIASFFSRGSNGQGGMNIFSFAYTAACDLANTLYAFAFGSSA